MKTKKIRIVLVVVAFSLYLSSVLAQSPEKISYQAMVRDLNNNLVSNQSIGVKISILQGSASGMPVYVEIFNPNPSTNANGLVTVEIGGGVPVSGNFSTIDWSSGPYFIKTEADPGGGTNYSIAGVSQLLSVPYALYAKDTDVDGSETIITGDSNVMINGNGTMNDPYSINVNSGNTFTRYGSSIAPLASSLIYSGYVYGSHYSHNATSNPVVIKSGDPGLTNTYNESLLYPVSLSGFTIPGITNGMYLNAAVCYTVYPTAIVWGTHAVPPGWGLLYKGYAYGSNIQHPGSLIGPICIDADNFEVTSPIGGSTGSLIYPKTIGFAAPGDIINTCIRCMVIYKQ